MLSYTTYGNYLVVFEHQGRESVLDHGGEISNGLGMNVLIACGGTGGHLFPGIALAEELVKRGHTPYLVISQKAVDRQAAEKYPQYTFVIQPSRPKPATTSPKMLGFVMSLFKVTRMSKQLIKDKEIDAVIGMGGFTCFGPVFAGKSLKVPTFLHDSNAVPGKTNRFLAKYVNKVLLGLEPAQTFFPDVESEVVGTPLRDEMKALPDREEACAKYGLKVENPTVLVFGGSQGAQKLNSLVIEASQLSDEAVQYLHVAGVADFERVSGLVGERANHQVLAFCDDMPSAYAVADVVLCRSGASSMTELSYLGLPSILVPYPVAADDHQTKNAEAFTAHEAALMYQERDLSGEKLEKVIKDLLQDDDLRDTLSKNVKALAHDPAATICNLIEATERP